MLFYNHNCMKCTVSHAEVSVFIGEIVNLWNSCIGDVFPLDERLFAQQALPEQPTSALFIARNAPTNPLAGAALAKIWTEKDEEGARSIGRTTGYISFLLVSPHERRKGLGEELLVRAEAWCVAHGASVIRLGTDNHHFFPGLPVDDSPRSTAAMRFFTEHGYVAGNIESDLIADLAAVELPLPPETTFGVPGYHFSLCAEQRRPAALRFLARAFPGRWHREIGEAFAAGMADTDLCLALRDDDDLPVGFARICDGESAHLSPGLFWRELLGPKPGALGPIGVDASCRGKGLGIGLLRASLATLKSRGVRNTVIDWTDLTGFYGKLGFIPWKRYMALSKVMVREENHSGPATR